MIRPPRGAWDAGRAVMVGSVFLWSAVLAGVRIDGPGLGYRAFGLVEGLIALLLLVSLVRSGALPRPHGPWPTVALVYGGAATAQLVAPLLPPPGVLEWVVIAGLLAFVWGAAYGLHRSRLCLALGITAGARAALKFSVLPFVWSRTQLPETPVIDLRDLGEGLKGLFIDYTPTAPGTQAVVLAAILLWGLAVWLAWPPEDEGVWVRRLPPSERDRLLVWLLAERFAREGHEGLPDEVKGYLDPGQEAD